MEQKYTIQLVEDEIDLLSAGLRFLEVNHPFKKEFRKLLNNIILQISQITLQFPLQREPVRDDQQLQVDKKKQDGQEVCLQHGE